LFLLTFRTAFVYPVLLTLSVNIVLETLLLSYFICINYNIILIKKLNNTVDPNEINDVSTVADMNRAIRQLAIQHPVLVGVRVVHVEETVRVLPAKLAQFGIKI